MNALEQQKPDCFGGKYTYGNCIGCEYSLTCRTATKAIDQMNLPNYATRCDGQQCPSRSNCKRYTERNTKDYVTWAAFWARREAGASACDMFAPVQVVTTFND